MTYPFLLEGNNFFKSKKEVIKENQIIKSKSYEDISEKLIEFFKENKNPKDIKIHNLAAKLKIEPDKLETEIYKILSTFLAGGKANAKGITEKDVDVKELAMGEKVEMEHLANTPCAKYLARRIATDHLAEMKDYYSKLAIMEKQK